MTIYLVSVVYWFLMIVEVAVTVYIFVSWLPLSPTLRKLMNYIMDPLLEPIRRLLRKSVVYIQGIDLSPIILYLLILYVRQLCLALR
ncbi:MAG TPA: YggT family protein [Candidatus Onthocola gallistercoris]|uniref:YggT family protein n=1 Tax=Candidatus Onthocola gallistercoris TaxID=2840876 RepID=A0A9D1HIS1_9FIRM|nr:YggT family protein [Candidatus Onthocola gallistercoris]